MSSLVCLKRKVICSLILKVAGMNINRKRLLRVVRVQTIPHLGVIDSKSKSKSRRKTSEQIESIGDECDSELLCDISKWSDGERGQIWLRDACPCERPIRNGKRKEGNTRQTVGYGVTLKPDSNPVFSSNVIHSQKGVCLVTSGNWSRFSLLTSKN